MQKMFHLKKDTRTTSEIKANEKYVKEKQAANGVEMLWKNMHTAYQQVGMPKEPIRSEWESWSVLSGMGELSEWGDYCRKQVEMASEGDVNFDPLDYVGFNLMVIMIPSQVTMDENLRRCYLKLSQG